MKTFCGYYNAGTCSSCRLIEKDISEQIGQKLDRLRGALKAHKDIDFLPPVSSSPAAFRNKAKMTVTGTIESPVIGLWGEADLDEGRELLACPVHHPKINAVLSAMPDFIRRCRLAPYQIAQKKGELKGLILYHSAGSGESYLRLVLRSKESIDRIKKHLPGLLQKFPGLSCVSVNIQPVAHALLEGEEEIILTERGHIRHMIAGLAVRLSPRGFVQTNQEVADKLYGTAAAWVRELKINKFAELFSGQGAFSFACAGEVQQGLGIEINPEAVAEANRTSAALNLPHLGFKCSAASQVREDLRAFAPDLVLVNPPRRGLGESLPLLLEAPAPYLIYSSCSVESLGADLARLSAGFSPIRAQLFDMFPHTEHFETLVLLQRL